MANSKKIAVGNNHRTLPRIPGQARFVPISIEVDGVTGAANPGVISVTAHGLANGDKAWIGAPTSSLSRHVERADRCERS